MEPSDNPWLEVSKTYRVHQETLEYTALCRSMGARPPSQTSLKDARASALTFNVTANGVHAYDGTETEFIIPASDDIDGVPVTVYTPNTLPEVPAILVYFHGGSLVFGSRKTHENAVKMISEKSGAIIVSVEYRLLPCPEDPLAPFNDSIAVTRWIKQFKEAIGGAADSKVGVGGDSAGGQIACCVVNDVIGLDFQILVYPVTDFACSLPSFQEFRKIPAFNTDDLEWRLALTNKPILNAAEDPRVNPSARKNLELTPPTLIILAELDPVRDSGLEYDRKLRSAGVEVDLELVHAVPHGFFSLPGIFKTKTTEAYGHVVKFIQKFQR
ncbi:ethyl acetate hydrolase-like [Physella acuta]|uniref:ethyl acetate hydrolase-like n=1 Tax=Physella acuta TaxID=109671 RepID=UPI0027DC19FB|nr:ethyl acetate hydrolase-like [Physella acuta]XP_059170294.1 ethyl acetate hydrolase-like [Physella acuta]